VLAVNQKSHDNQPHFLADGQRVWTARAENGDYYLAIFNTSDKAADLGFDLSRLGLKTAKVRDLWSRTDIGTTTGSFISSVPSHGAGLWRFSV